MRKFFTVNLALQLLWKHCDQIAVHATMEHRSNFSQLLFEHFAYCSFCFRSAFGRMVEGFLFSDWSPILFPGSMELCESFQLRMGRSLCPFECSSRNEIVLYLFFSCCSDSNAL